MINYELGERVLAALYEENSGTIYKRKAIIVDRWFDGVIVKTEVYKEEAEKILKDSMEDLI